MSYLSPEATRAGLQLPELRSWILLFHELKFPPFRYSKLFHKGKVTYFYYSSQDREELIIGIESLTLTKVLSDQSTYIYHSVNSKSVILFKKLIGTCSSNIIIKYNTNELYQVVFINMANRLFATEKCWQN